MVMGFHSHFFHPHLTSPIKGEEVFSQFWQTGDQEPPSRGQPEATRSAGGASLRFNSDALRPQKTENFFHREERHSLRRHLPPASLPQTNQAEVPSQQEGLLCSTQQSLHNLRTDSCAGLSYRPADSRYDASYHKIYRWLRRMNFRWGFFDPEQKIKTLQQNSLSGEPCGKSPIPNEYWRPHIISVHFTLSREQEQPI